MTDSAEKDALRRKMRAARKACTNRATRDDCLLQRLTALSVYQTAPCVLSYVSFGTEAGTQSALCTEMRAEYKSNGILPHHSFT